MTTLIQHLTQLKAMTLERKADFSKIFNYFMTHIGEKQYDCFVPVSQHDILEPVLTRLGKQVYGEDVAMTSLMLMGLEEHHFLHGTARFSNNLFLCLYFFEDILSGIACNIFGPVKDYTDYYRLGVFVSNTERSDQMPLPGMPSSEVH